MSPRLTRALLLLAVVAAMRQAPAAPGTDTVKIILLTAPVVKAEVTWERKRIGIIDGGPRKKPLVIERPRDSGPLDVVVRAEGFLPVHTRVYTFSDSKITVKLTAVAEKATLFGYRQQTPPDGGARDGGATDAGRPLDTRRQ